jgi:hypothetical protein
MGNFCESLEVTVSQDRFTSPNRRGLTTLPNLQEDVEKVRARISAGQIVSKASINTTSDTHAPDLLSIGTIVRSKGFLTDWLIPVEPEGHIEENKACYRRKESIF